MVLNNLIMSILKLYFILLLTYSSIWNPTVIAINTNRGPRKISNLFPSFSTIEKNGKFYGTIVPLILTGTAIVIEGYARIPQRFIFTSSPSPLKNLPEDKDILIIFPGAGGPDQNIKDLYEKIQQEDKLNKIDRFVSVYDWSAWVGNLFRAAYDSEEVGRNLAIQVSTYIKPSKRIRNIHAIGISVGAFAANSFLKTINERVKTPTYKRLTLLDPFTSKGIFGPVYGPKNFGDPKYVDFAEQYYNSDDPVPSTNTPLPNFVAYDVTKASSKSSFIPLPGDSTHSYPVVYLMENWKTITERGNLIRKLHELELSRGLVITIES